MGVGDYSKFGISGACVGLKKGWLHNYLICNSINSCSNSFAVRSLMLTPIRKFDGVGSLNSFFNSLDS